MSMPVLPVFTLRRGQHRVEIFDPRPDPRVLGARYVQGGYIRAWWVGERCLTGRSKAYWDAFDGEGLPETFETTLGWGTVPMQGEILRIGAGRLRRQDDDPREHQASHPLVTTVEWTVVSQSEDRLVMRTQDRLTITHGVSIGYRLEREIVLTDLGPVSTTRLDIDCDKHYQSPWTWFAHPFFAAKAIHATRLRVDPELQRIERGGAERRGQGTGTLRSEGDGHWGFEEGYCRSTLAGPRPITTPLRVHCDPALGGGVVTMTCDRAIDHLVVFAGDNAFSVEPKLAGSGLDGHRTTWSLGYQFLPDASGEVMNNR